MAESQRLKIIYGTFFWGKLETEEIQSYVNILAKHDVKDLDTATGYVSAVIKTFCLALNLDADDCLRKTARKRSENQSTYVASPFTQRLKGFVCGGLSKESVISAMKQSLDDLKVDQVETLLLHTPDQATPIEETLEAVQHLYEAGKFRQFGLSNFLPSEVEKIHTLAASKGYVLPTVYEGNYNPVARHAETELISLLRRLGMSFWACSPLVGGFLVHNPDSVMNGRQKRFAQSWWLGKTYRKLYGRPRLLEVLPEWHAIAKEAGWPVSALAYRWVVYNSILSSANSDAMIVGATKTMQLEQTLDNLSGGPLSEKIVQRVDSIWASVQDEAPLDNFHY